MILEKSLWSFLVVVVAIVIAVVIAVVVVVVMANVWCNIYNFPCTTDSIDFAWLCCDSR